MSPIFLLTIIHRSSVGFRSGQFAGQSSTVTSWSLHQLLYLWQCGSVPRPAGKCIQLFHEASQQMEARSALNILVDGCVDRRLQKTVNQHQQITELNQIE
ncbi:hypothetical protein CHARACLAT_025161 [Characodon lateralis]|uniref:Uncharacterized protein n=1 Tax=Characodon lateralis TaxID=208331 RepID=A0ABU7ECZ5_9TELE|nr:hypothetical protein [Characodon lateralis]